MDYYRHLFLTDGPKKDISFTMVYLLSTIFAFQSLLTAYSSSTYLEQFIATKYIGLVYALGAIGAIILTIFAPNILRKIGNVNFILSLMVLMSVLLAIIGLAPTPFLTIAAFILFLIINPQAYLNIDIFLETLIGTDEHTTGSKRGIILTFMSIASFFSPLAMGYIIGIKNNLADVYFVSAGIGLIIIMFIVAKLRHFYDPPYEIIKIRKLLTGHINDIDIKIVLYTQFLLQFFYTWAIIYFPLYLASSLGFDWETISKIIAVGLFAFVIFEYPIGRLADEKIGEKEMMALGFVFLAISSACFSFLDTNSVLTWMILIFLTRVGASLVEVTSESYFFKKVRGNDSNLISLFRLTRPLANLAGAILGSVVLLFLPFNLIFVVLGIIMVTGIFVTTKLTDTR